ncbi:hypothetical protein F6476_05485 [Pseudomonas umsongensis]|uniref:hypothetical protein n=1 Tax=Pseudomonas umsongensis TaxID=198618 RepID=UPI001248AA85|nr:hypothetical protein [Pseudomonas umsongensis]QFG28693.1 hypothetical protein F6476_05485 [Pseudomonas umsongensis]
MTILDFTERKKYGTDAPETLKTRLAGGCPPAHPFLHNTVKMHFMTRRSRIMRALRKTSSHKQALNRPTGEEKTSDG